MLGSQRKRELTIDTMASWALDGMESNRWTDPYTAHWAVLNKGGILDHEYTIELDKAAAWKPRRCD